MITRIGCGGFDIDNDTLIEEDGVLKVKNGGGGGGGGGVFTIGLTKAGGTLTLNKTFSEIFEAAKAGSFCIITANSGDTASYMYVVDVSLLNNVNGFIDAFYVANPVAVTWKVISFQVDTPDDYPTAELS